MKNTIKKSLPIFLLSLMVASCGKQTASRHTRHIDMDLDGICDTCGKDVSQESNVYRPSNVQPITTTTNTPDKVTTPTSKTPEDTGKTTTANSAIPLKDVARIKVKSLPTKSEYFVEDDFDPEGGVLSVTYADRTTGDVPFTDPNVSFQNSSLTAAGSKTITVVYGGKKATFVVSVLEVGGIVTFDLNYPGATNIQVKVGVGRGVSKPEDPLRDQYTFFDWYTDSSLNVAYEFSSENIITSNITIYASWKGKSDSVVTYDYNYYGKKKTTYSQVVTKGNSPRQIPDPTRDGFSFVGWYKDEGLTQSFATTDTISSDTTLRAKWQRIDPSFKEYLFEAENTSFEGKVGPGFSGESVGANMIVVDTKDDTSLNASGGRYASSLYENGLGLEFYFASSEAVSDATVGVYLSLDPSLTVDSLSFTSTEYEVIVNGAVQTFADFTVTHTTFSEKIHLTNISLHEGANMIQLLTNNDRNPLGRAGAGTYRGSAPVVDCIKIGSESVLIWDENYNLPANVQ